MAYMKGIEPAEAGLFTRFVYRLMRRKFGRGRHFGDLGLPCETRRPPNRVIASLVVKNTAILVSIRLSA